MQLRYVFADQQLHLRSVTVDEDQRVADLLALIPPQLLLDSRPRYEELALYRAQKHGDRDAPWMCEDDGDYLALCCGDKDVEAAFCVETTRLEPSQRLGDVFGSLDATLLSSGAIHVIAKVGDAEDLSSQPTTPTPAPAPAPAPVPAAQADAIGGQVVLDARTAELFQLIATAAMTTLLMTAMAAVKMAVHWRKAVAACEAQTESCEERLVFWTTAFLAFVLAASTVLVLHLQVKVLRAMFTRVAPTLRGIERWFLTFAFLLLATATSAGIFSRLTELNGATELIEYVATVLLYQDVACTVLAGLVSEVTRPGSGTSWFAMTVTTVFIANNALK